MSAETTSGILGQDEVATTPSWTTLYTVPQNARAKAKVTVCNRSGSARTYSIRIRPNGASAANKHIIANAVSAPTGQPHSSQYYDLLYGDVVEGNASGASVNMAVDGEETGV